MWVHASVATALALLLFATVSLPLVLVGGDLLALVLAVASALLVLRTAHAGLDLYAVPLALATILAFDFFYLEPLRTFGLSDYQNWSALGLYLVVIVVVCAVSARTRRRLVSLDRVQAALLDEVSALRRISRIAAAGASPTEVFTATAEEIGRLASLDFVRVLRYEPDGTATVVAGWGRTDGVLPAGDRLVLDGDTVSARVLQTGEPARIDDYGTAHGALAELASAGGVRSAIGCPIFLGGRLWGVMAVGSLRAGTISEDAGARVANFTELVAMALSNAQDRTDLIASRSRIVVAVDDARRRLERDLHDGVQQRLVSLALDVRRLRSRVPQELTDVQRELHDLGGALAVAVEELREIAHGIHPAILATGGLTAALKSLARRSAVPVELDLHVDGDLPDRVEIAAYYLVSEALTNTAKHAHASTSHVRVTQTGDELRIEVTDDGVGGADRDQGSGLLGMEDRTHALGGRLSLTSHPGHGTTLEVSLPTT